MCILFILRKKRSSWPVMLAANRDEYFDRTFLSPGFHWKKFPFIFAGKDKKEGGSWLGVNAYGVCIAILNRRSNLKSLELKSRGGLVIDLLKQRNATAAKDLLLKKFEKKYNFFNLIIADNKSAYWIKYENYLIEAFSIPYGHSIIDNQNLNDNNSLRQALNKDTFYKSRSPIPEKNFFTDWQKLLILQKQNVDEKAASIYVNKKDNNYGTVCSSIIGLPSNEKNSNDIFWLYRNSFSRKPYFNKLRVFK